MAEECRRLAAAAKDDVVRSQLLAVADHFAQLAEQRQPRGNLAAFRPMLLKKRS
jgi:hypothetical protein